VACYNVLQCVAVCYSALQYVAVRCGVLQCVAVCCGTLRVQCHALLSGDSILHDMFLVCVFCVFYVCCVCFYVGLCVCMCGMCACVCECASQCVVVCCSGTPVTSAVIVVALLHFWCVCVYMCFCV